MGWLAAAVPYSRTFTVNNCRVWARKLLRLFVDEEMITEELFFDICMTCGLPGEVAEEDYATYVGTLTSSAKQRSALDP